MHVTCACAYDFVIFAQADDFGSCVWVVIFVHV